MAGWLADQGYVEGLVRIPGAMLPAVPNSVLIKEGGLDAATGLGEETPAK